MTFDSMSASAWARYPMCVYVTNIGEDDNCELRPVYGVKIFRNRAPSSSRRVRAPRRICQSPRLQGNKEALRWRVSLGIYRQIAIPVILLMQQLEGSRSGNAGVPSQKTCMAKVVPDCAKSKYVGTD